MRHLAVIVESPRNKSQHEKTTGNHMNMAHTGSAVMPDWPLTNSRHSIYTFELVNTYSTDFSSNMAVLLCVSHEHRVLGCHVEIHKLFFPDCKAR